DVVDEPAVVGDVGAGADAGVDVRDRRGARVPRVGVDHLRPTARARPPLGIHLGLHEPLEAHRVGLRGVRAVDQDEVGVTDVTPVIRHRAPPECGRQTDDRRAVSDAGLLFYVHHPQGAHDLGGQVAFLGGEGGTAGEGDTLAAVDDVAVPVLHHERRVAGVLDPLGEAVEHRVPAHLLPPVAPRRPIERLGHAPGRHGELHGRGTLGAQPALVDRAVRITLDLQELDVALLVLPRVGDQTAANRAVRAERVHLFGAGDPEALLDLHRPREVEAEPGEAGGTGA